MNSDETINIETETTWSEAGNKSCPDLKVKLKNRRQFSTCSFHETLAIKNIRSTLNKMGARGADPLVVKNPRITLQSARGSVFPHPQTQPTLITWSCFSQYWEKPRSERTRAGQPRVVQGSTVIQLIILLLLRFGSSFSNFIRQVWPTGALIIVTVPCKLMLISCRL